MTKGVLHTGFKLFFTTSARRAATGQRHRLHESSAHAPQRRARASQRRPRHPPSAGTEARRGRGKTASPDPARGSGWQRAHIRLGCATLPNVPVLPIATHGCSGPPVRTCRKTTGSDLPIRSRSAKLRRAARQRVGANAARALLRAHLEALTLSSRREHACTGMSAMAPARARCDGGSGAARSSTVTEAGEGARYGVRRGTARRRRHTRRAGRVIAAVPG